MFMPEAIMLSKTDLSLQDGPSVQTIFVLLILAPEKFSCYDGTVPKHGGCCKTKIDYESRRIAKRQGGLSDTIAKYEIKADL